MIQLDDAFCNGGVNISKAYGLGFGAEGGKKVFLDAPLFRCYSGKFAPRDEALAFIMPASGLVTQKLVFFNTVFPAKAITPAGASLCCWLTILRQLFTINKSVAYFWGALCFYGFAGTIFLSSLSLRK
jgi:hypothetical protein